MMLDGVAKSAPSTLMNAPSFPVRMAEPVTTPSEGICAFVPLATVETTALS